MREQAGLTRAVEVEEGLVLRAETLPPCSSAA
jgi:hypothetical protein